MITDTIFLVTIIVIGAFILIGEIIAGVLRRQRIQDSEQAPEILSAAADPTHSLIETEKFTRFALLAIVLLLSFISYLLYDRLVLLPQRVARALQEAKTVADRAEMERWNAALAADSAAFQAQVKKEQDIIDAYCKKHPSDIAFCGAPKRKQEKKP